MRILDLAGGAPRERSQQDYPVRERPPQRKCCFTERDKGRVRPRSCKRQAARWRPDHCITAFASRGFAVGFLNGGFYPDVIIGNRLYPSVGSPEVTDLVADGVPIGEADWDVVHIAQVDGLHDNDLIVVVAGTGEKLLYLSAPKVDGLIYHGRFMPPISFGRVQEGTVAFETDEQRRDTLHGQQEEVRLPKRVHFRSGTRHHHDQPQRCRPRLPSGQLHRAYRLPRGDQLLDLGRHGAHQRRAGCGERRGGEQQPVAGYRDRGRPPVFVSNEYITFDNAELETHTLAPPSVGVGVAAHNGKRGTEYPTFVECAHVFLYPGSEMSRSGSFFSTVAYCFQFRSKVSEGQRVRVGWSFKLKFMASFDGSNTNPPEPFQDRWNEVMVIDNEFRLGHFIP